MVENREITSSSNSLFLANERSWDNFYQKLKQWHCIDREKIVPNSFLKTFQDCGHLQWELVDIILSFSPNNSNARAKLMLALSLLPIKRTQILHGLITSVHHQQEENNTNSPVRWLFRLFLASPFLLDYNSDIRSRIINEVLTKFKDRLDHLPNALLKLHHKGILTHDTLNILFIRSGVLCLERVETLFFLLELKLSFSQIDQNFKKEYLNLNYKTKAPHFIEQYLPKNIRLYIQLINAQVVSPHDLMEKIVPHCNDPEWTEGLRFLNDPAHRSKALIEAYCNDYERYKRGQMTPSRFVSLVINFVPGYGICKDDKTLDMDALKLFSENFNVYGKIEHKGCIRTYWPYVEELYKLRKKTYVVNSPKMPGLILRRFIQMSYFISKNCNDIKDIGIYQFIKELETHNLLSQPIINRLFLDSTDPLFETLIKFPIDKKIRINLPSRIHKIILQVYLVNEAPIRLEMINQLLKLGLEDESVYLKCLSLSLMPSDLQMLYTSLIYRQESNEIRVALFNQLIACLPVLFDGHQVLPAFRNVPNHLLSPRWPTIVRLCAVGTPQNARAQVNRLLQTLVLQPFTQQGAGRVLNEQQSTHTASVHLSTDITVWILNSEYRKNGTHCMRDQSLFDAISLFFQSGQFAALPEEEKRKLNYGKMGLERILNLSGSLSVSVERKKAFLPIINHKLKDVFCDQDLSILNADLEKETKIALAHFVKIIYSEAKRRFLSSDATLYAVEYAFLDACYEVHRGYNLSDQGIDDLQTSIPICFGGTANKFCEKLSSFSHNILYYNVNPMTLQLKIMASFMECIREKVDSLRQADDEAAHVIVNNLMGEKYSDTLEIIWQNKESWLNDSLKKECEYLIEPKVILDALFVFKNEFLPVMTLDHLPSPFTLTKTQRDWWEHQKSLALEKKNMDISDDEQEDMESHSKRRRIGLFERDCSSLSANSDEISPNDGPAPRGHVAKSLCRK